MSTSSALDTRRRYQRGFSPVGRFHREVVGDQALLIEEPKPSIFLHKRFGTFAEELGAVVPFVLINPFYAILNPALPLSEAGLAPDGFPAFPLKHAHPVSALLSQFQESFDALYTPKEADRSKRLLDADSLPALIFTEPNGSTKRFDKTKNIFIPKLLAYCLMNQAVYQNPIVKEFYLKTICTRLQPFSHNVVSMVICEYRFITPILRRALSTTKKQIEVFVGLRPSATLIPDYLNVVSSLSFPEFASRFLSFVLPDIGMAGLSDRLEEEYAVWQQSCILRLKNQEAKNAVPEPAKE